MTTTPLPPVDNASAEDHAQISRRFLEQARVELSLEDRIQASEKVWGAAAHALKAIAVERGWHHGSHAHVNGICGQLAKEFSRDDFYSHMGLANAMHMNFYENNLDEDAIANALTETEQFIAKLDELRASLPRPYTVASRTDQRRFTLLLGLPREQPLPLGAHSNVGFSQTHPEDGQSP